MLLLKINIKYPCSKCSTPQNELFSEDENIKLKNCLCKTCVSFKDIHIDIKYVIIKDNDRVLISELHKINNYLYLTFVDTNTKKIAYKIPV